MYYLPATEDFQNRYLFNGGGGGSVDGGMALGAGLVYGAASGATDGGFTQGSNTQLTANQISAGGNGTIQWSKLESFGYQAIHEMTVTGKELTRAFFNVSETDLKAYYLGCSEGGREGHQSTQKYPTDFNGVDAAAPGHVFSDHATGTGLAKRRDGVRRGIIPVLAPFERSRRISSRRVMRMTV